MGRKQNADRGLLLRKYPSGKEVWYIRFTVNEPGKPPRDVKLVGGKTKEQARRKLHKKLTERDEGTLRLTPTKAETLAGAIDRYRPIARRQKNYPKTKAFFSWWENRLGKFALHKLAPSQIEQAQSALLAEGKSPATVNRYTDWLRHICNRELRDSRMHGNPVAKVRRLRESKGRVRFLSQAEEAMLLGALGPVYASYARFAILTGLRQAEQFKLEWSHVDLDRSLLACR